MHTVTDADGSEVRVMTTGERTGWAQVLILAAVAEARGDVTTCQLAASLTHAADRAERQSFTAERRGDHVLATICQESAEVCDYAAERLSWA